MKMSDNINTDIIIQRNKITLKQINEKKKD